MPDQSSLDVAAAILTHTFVAYQFKDQKKEQDNGQRMDEMLSMYRDIRKRIAPASSA